MDEEKEVQSTSEIQESDGEEKSPDILELLYGIMAKPAATMERLANRPPVGAALVVFTVSTIISTLVVARDVPFYGHGIPNLGALAGLATAAGLIFAYGGWFIGTAVIHLWAELLGGRGRALALFSAAGMLSFIQLFNVPAAVIAKAVGDWFSNMVSLAVFGWLVVLYVISVKTIYRISVGRAIAALLLPVIVTFAVIVALVAITVAAITNALPFLQQQFPFFP